MKTTFTCSFLFFCASSGFGGFFLIIFGASSDDGSSSSPSGVNIGSLSSATSSQVPPSPGDASPSAGGMGGGSLTSILSADSTFVPKNVY